MKRILICMTAMSLVCMAPGFGLWAQDAGQESSYVRLEPKKDDSGKWGFVNEQRKEVIPFKYEAALPFSEGLATVKLKGKVGFIDETGREVIPCKYANAAIFSEGLAAVMLKRKWGFIDKTNQLIIPYTYEETALFSDGLAPVQMGGNWGLIDKSAQEVIPCLYQEIVLQSDGLYRVELKGDYGFIDKTGQVVIPCKYQELRPFSEGLAVVQWYGNYGFIDKTGQEVIPCKYQSVTSFVEGLAKVRLNDKWSFIDKTGQEVIPLDKYEETSLFSQDLAEVKRDSKWGFIDKTGNEVIPCKYDHIVTPFMANGKAFVVLGDELKHIDETGTETEPTSHWSGLPAKINDEMILDFVPGVDGKGNTFISIITGTRFEPVKSLYTACDFESGGKKHSSKNSNIDSSKFLRIFLFETNDRPETVIFYSIVGPDKKIRIECKEQQTAN